MQIDAHKSVLVEAQHQGLACSGRPPPAPFGNDIRITFIVL
ncbi:hypothetical protein [Arthrobacter sp. ISL-30]|nr:hypothetical protein [Arthrobacter sp. ISL-30]